MSHRRAVFPWDRHAIGQRRAVEALGRGGELVPVRRQDKPEAFRADPPLDEASLGDALDEMVAGATKIAKQRAR